MAQNYFYKCNTCSKTYNMNQIRYLCPDCAKKNTTEQPPLGVLKTLYDYDHIASKKSADLLFPYLKKTGFIDLLPIKSLQNFPNLKIGNTPLYQIGELDNKKLNFNLYLKDDSQNPTYSFKDRASALVSAFAKENNVEKIVVASTGNAGSSMAGICAANGQKAYVILPATASRAKLTQTMMYGAKLIPIDGNYDDCFDLSIEASNKFGWYNRNTAYNPLTIEGKKTASFELFEQLEYFEQNVLDRIFVPVGDGVIISGIYKGFEDLLKLGIISKIPKIVAVQAKGSNNLIGNLHKEIFTISRSSTIADSISVDIPRNFYMAAQYLKRYGGESIAVSDDEILNASQNLGSNTGLFAEPAAAAAFAGFITYCNNDILEAGSNNIVLLTGSGLKDIEAFKEFIPQLKVIDPDPNELIKVIGI